MVMQLSNLGTTNRLILIPIKVLFAIGLCIFVCFVMLVTALSMPYKLSVRIIAWLFQPKLKGFVDPDSSLFAIDDFKKPQSNVIMYYTCAGPVTAEDAQSAFYDRVIDARDEKGKYMYTKMKHHVETFMGYLFYVEDENFDVRNHMRRYDYQDDLYIPSPCNEDDLRKAVGGLLTKPWKEGQSPWEVLFIYNYSSKASATKAEGGEQTKEETLVICILHHLLGNGLSIAELMQKVSTKPLELPRPDIPRRSKYMQILMTALMPVKLFYDMADSLIDNYCGDHLWTKKERNRTYYTAFTNPIPIELTKKVKDLHGVNFLSVSLAAISGAMHRVMSDVGHKVPERIKIVFTIPNPKQPEGLYNTTFFTFTNLPIEKNTTPKNLKEISKKLGNLKLSFDTLGYGIIVKCISLLPTGAGQFCKGSFATAVISSFPVLQETGQFANVEVTDIISTIGPCNAGCGIIILMCGVGGNQRISMSIDKSLIANEQQWLKIGPYVESELLHLYDLGVSNNGDSNKKLNLC